LWDGAPGIIPGAPFWFHRPVAPGIPITMTDDRTDERAADLLPEERAAGSDDPRAQAEAILADSDRREDHPEPAEERRSDETVNPGRTTR
jgi:hypothetical protein